ncbi:MULTISPECIES: response regulator transcription factor [unclassified Stenotrophomonas]|uniref:response regulator transcription factor n=1 Tax=unclassified Stenotrophomonas TaxID=196198 RepID=UPI0024B4E3EC|nr:MULTISPECIES: response regulator transcription factor [unclassified Stenotrophomonas]MDI9248319.1 response regulator transcription factor [Stenotrophomonas sp. RS-48]MDI9271809.1 response regulator transcription factor [Stenotrophomonas sp. PFBMAA-4]
MISLALVEDDAQMRDKILVPGLRDYGFDVRSAGTAADFFRLIKVRDTDLVLVDLSLPDLDGLELLSRLRQRQEDVGIVVLTARRGRQDHLAALLKGADLYFKKPADIELVALSMRQLAKRLDTKRLADQEGQSESPEKQNRQLATWKLQDDGWVLWMEDSGSVALNVSERLLMRALVAARGKSITRGALAALLSEDVAACDVTRLDMVIHRLRKKLATLNASGETLQIVARRGIGYSLEASSNLLPIAER